MSVFEELKRRNVFRVGIAYVVTAWLILQVADVVLGNIEGVPEWFFPTLLTIIVIGFPVALLLAWAYELTPEGVKRERDIDPREERSMQSRRVLDRVIIAVLALALAYFAVDKFVLEETADIVEARVVPASKSIAVLPFRSIGSSDDGAAFADGMHDDILTQLTKIASLDKVISRTTAEGYRDSAKSISEIGAELGVATILEGSVQRAGDRVRVNMQLIDTERDNHLWADNFDRELTIENLFTIQSEITREVVEALQAVLTVNDESRLETLPTESLAAWEQVALGREWLEKRTPAALDEARRYFEQAIDIDPEYALAWVGLADAVALTTDHAAVPKAETFETRQTAIDRALAIDADSGEALTSLALLRSDQGELDEADRLFREAIEKSPNYAPAYHWYAILLGKMKREEVALEHVERALELDPGAPVVRNNLVITLNTLGRYEEAREVLREGIRLNPEFPLYYERMAGMLAGDGRLAEAARWAAEGAEQAPGHPSVRIEHCDFLIHIDLRVDACIAALERDFDRLPGERFMQLTLERDVLRLDLDAAIARSEALLGPDAPADLVMAVATLHIVNGAPQRAWEIAGDVLDTVVPMPADEITQQDLQPLVIAGIVLYGRGSTDRADAILDAVLTAMSGMQRSGPNGYSFFDVPIHVTRGDRERAVAALADVLESGTRLRWYYLRTPAFDPMTSDPEWNRLIALLEEDVAEQRAAYLEEQGEPLF